MHSDPITLPISSAQPSPESTQILTKLTESCSLASVDGSLPQTNAASSDHTLSSTRASSQFDAVVSIGSCSGPWPQGSNCSRISLTINFRVPSTSPPASTEISSTSVLWVGSESVTSYSIVWSDGARMATGCTTSSRLTGLPTVMAWPAVSTPSPTPLSLNLTKVSIAAPSIDALLVWDHTLDASRNFSVKCRILALTFSLRLKMSSASRHGHRHLPFGTPESSSSIPPSQSHSAST